MAKIMIDGEIGCPDFWGDKPELNLTYIDKFLKEIPTEDSQLDIYIDSFGGSCSTGLAIHNRILSYKKDTKAVVKTHIVGYCMSIAAVLAMAGDDIIMYPGSIFMIHPAWTYTYGNAKALREEAYTLDLLTKEIANVFALRLDKDRDSVIQFMEKEQLLGPEEALSLKYINTVFSLPPKDHQNRFTEAGRSILSGKIKDSKYRNFLREVNTNEYSNLESRKPLSITPLNPITFTDLLEQVPVE